MKIKIQYILFAGLMFSLSSCLFEEKSLFPESPALRLNHAIDNAKETLIAANNGWVMEYFPTNDTEGYTFLMSFSTNTFATIAAKNKYTPAYTTDSSAFDVIGDNGPVLTFNTYNKVFSLFSDPKDPMGGDALNGLGLEGDYEFIIMNVTNDLIKLKGKKRGTEILMHPLAQGQEWQGYFSILGRMDSTLFNPKLPVTLTLTNGKGGDPYYLTDGVTHIFTAKTQSQTDSGDQGENIPFIVTDYGLRFAQPVTLYSNSGADSVLVQAFRLSDDKSKLVCTEDGNSTITGPQPGDFLQGNSSTFLAEKSETSGMDDLFGRVAAGMISGFNANYELTKIGFGKKDNRSALVLYTKNGITAMFNIPMVFEGNKASITTFDAENMTNADMDNNARLFYGRNPTIKGLISELLRFVQGDYTVETSTPFTLQVIKYMKTDGSLMLNVSR